MKILLVGNGGREHALAWRLKQSASVQEVLCPNGNPGIAQVARAPRVELKSTADWVELARREGSDLVVVGPEAPLEQGLADAMEAAGIPVFGPVRAGARLEFSKAYAKQIMREADIPTAQAESFTDATAAKDFARSLGLPVVIKADGLAAGKGVTVAQTWAEAEQAIDENLRDQRFGAASASVLVEEFMAGEEASIFGLCDGTDVVPLVPAQDHKRVFDGDQGPNTGGMGAYAPAPVATEAIVEEVQRRVFLPLVKRLREVGIDYRGVIYAGLMLSPGHGPRVVEFNCRFGDPETQVVLPLIEGDMGELFMACAQGRLRSFGEVRTRTGAATTVVLASGGYPGDYKTGLPISGLEKAAEEPDAIVFHAGTAVDAEGRVVTAGGRVLACTAWDSTLARSVERAYRLVEAIDFPGKHHRRDIAHRALGSRS